MYSEYAVQPEAISEGWRTCRYLAELFGFDRGRLLSQYPKKWLPMAIDATAHLPPVEKQRVIEKLRRLKEQASIRGSRSFDPSSGDWINNAISQHAASPFRAIIAVNSVAGHPDVVVPDDITETHPLFVVTRSSKIPREACAITAVVAPLLSCARRVLLVDKYYDPFNAKYQRTIRELLKVIHGSSVDIEIHYCEHSRCPDALAVEREARGKFLGVIPTGLTIKLVRWREKANGMNFHARYLLTDRGGIGFDAGFSSEGEHQRTDVQLLEARFAIGQINNLDATAVTYEQVGPRLQIDSNGVVSHV